MTLTRLLWHLWNRCGCWLRLLFLLNSWLERCCRLLISNLLCWGRIELILTVSSLLQLTSAIAESCTPKLLCEINEKCW